MSRWIHGRAVQDGEVRFLSASSIQKADASTSTGCTRAWWYQYISGIKEPPSPAMERGTKLHAEIEEFLTTGNRQQLSSLALSGLHMLPTPGPDLLVEHSIVPTNPQTNQEDLSLAPLRLADIPVLGKIDLLHARRINYGTDDIEQQLDPEGTVETCDHKTTSDIKNAKSANELPEQLQLAIYGEYAFRVVPDLKLIRLSHTYFPGRGSARKSSLLVDRDRLQSAWNHAGAVARTVKDAARETNPDHVEANTRACHAYGRDCPARSVCTAASHNSLASIIGSTAADRVLNPNANPNHMNSAGASSMSASPIIPVSGLLARLNAIGQGTPGPAATSPVSLTAPVTQTSVSVQAPVQTPVIAPIAPVTPVVSTIAPDIVAEMARLQAAVAPPTSASNRLLATLVAIDAHGLGRPTFSGSAAQAVGAANGYAVTLGAGLAGSGTLAQYTVAEIAQLDDVLANLVQVASSDNVTRACDSPRMQPSALPTAQHVVTAPVESEARVEEHTTPVVETPTKRKRRTKAEIEAAKAVEQTALSVEADINVTPMQQPATTVLSDAVETLSIDVSAAPEAIVESVATTLTLEDARSFTRLAALSATPSVERLHFYVDCTPDGVDSDSFWDVIDEITHELTIATGEKDFRLSAKLDYGKWKAAVSAALREKHTNKPFTGHQTLTNASTEMGQVVVETMRDIVRRSGGVMVRGTR